MPVITGLRWWRKRILSALGNVYGVKKLVEMWTSYAMPVSCPVTSHLTNPEIPHPSLLECSVQKMRVAMRVWDGCGPAELPIVSVSQKLSIPPQEFTYSNWHHWDKATTTGFFSSEQTSSRCCAHIANSESSRFHSQFWADYCASYTVAKHKVYTLHHLLKPVIKGTV